MDFKESTIKTYSGLSSETKPTIAAGTDVPNGSRWREIETGKIYHFNLKDDNWYLAYDPSSGVPPTFSKTTSSAETFAIQKGQLNKLRLRPQIINEHAESSRNIISVVTAANIVGQFFKASQDNINGINMTFESAAGIDFDDFESYADSAALQAEWIASGATEAILDLSNPHDGTQCMAIDTNALVGSEWERSFISTDFNDFTGQFWMYTNRTYADVKMRVYVRDSATNTNSASIITAGTNVYNKYIFDTAGLTPDGVTPADLADIVGIGFRLESKKAGTMYFDDLVSVPNPGEIALKLWDMGSTLPASTVESLDDGTQYIKLGDAGISGLQEASVSVSLLGGKRMYHINEFIAGVALESPLNEILIPDNYYAITVHYVDTEVSVYGPNSAWDDYYINGYSFTAPDEATPITATGAQEDLMFVIYSTQDIYIKQIAQFIDEEPNGSAETNIFVEDKNMKITDIIQSGAQAVQVIIQDRNTPEFMAKGGKFEEYYNDDFTDSVSTVNLGFRVVFEPNTPNG